MQLNLVKDFSQLGFLICLEVIHEPNPWLPFQTSSKQSGNSLYANILCDLKVSCEFCIFSDFSCFLLFLKLGIMLTLFWCSSAYPSFAKFSKALRYHELRSLNILGIIVLKSPNIFNHTKTRFFHIQGPGSLSLPLIVTVSGLQLT